MVEKLGRHKGKRPLRRLRGRWEDIIYVRLKDIKIETYVLFDCVKSVSG
jgi:hypothetical protein